MILFAFIFSHYYLKFYTQKKIFENNKYIISKISDIKYGNKFVNNITNYSNSEKSIHLLIIGETAYRDHHGIYGYLRQTTPNLDKIKDDLVIFNDVISPTPRTDSSLRRALTLVSNENERLSEDFSIIQMMRG